MTATTTDIARSAPDCFRHEALLYAGDAGFLDGIVPFIQDGIAHDEPVLVVVDARRIDLLQSALDGQADRAHFADMAEVGHNPARIIPAWREFLDEHATGGRPVRGVGEPIWPGRAPAELAESQLHESLLNVAFDSTPSFWLLCPYDTDALGADVLEEAHRSHPFLLDEGGHRDSDSWCPDGGLDRHLGTGWTEPARHLAKMTFGLNHLSGVRATVAAHARRFGMDRARVEDLVLAVNELATNSLEHGGGQGRFRLWRDGQSLICEMSDEGYIEDPLAGRTLPSTTDTGGRGLWLANQVCDLVQIRSVPSASSVRVHMSLNG